MICAATTWDKNTSHKFTRSGWRFTTNFNRCNCWKVNDILLLTSIIYRQSPSNKGRTANFSLEFTPWSEGRVCCKCIHIYIYFYVYVRIWVFHVCMIHPCDCRTLRVCTSLHCFFVQALVDNITEMQMISRIQKCLHQYNRLAFIM